MREFSVGWWEGVARAIFGYQRHDPLQLEDTIRAVAVFESERPEWGLLKAEHHFVTGNLTEAAIAGEFTFIGLRNPIESGVLAVVEGFYADVDGQQARAGLVGTAFDPAIRLASRPAVFQDTRAFSSTLSFGPSSACEIIQGTATAAELTNISTPYGLWRSRADNGIAARSWQADNPWVGVIGPGTLVVWSHILIGNPLSGSVFRWRERPLFKGLRA